MGAIFKLIRPLFGFFNKVGMQVITSKTSPLAKTAILLALASNIISKDVAEFIMVYLNNTSTAELISSAGLVYITVYINGPLWAYRKRVIKKIEGSYGK